jgi:HD-like signal output (HDOD) protein
LTELLQPFDEGVDRRFSARLLGIADLRPAEARPAERRVIDRLAALVREGGDANLMPRLPVVLPRLMALVRRDEVSPRELVDRLSHDPTLVGEAVRLANSPRYRTGRDIADLQEAVLVLGQRGLIQIVIGATMRPLFDVQQGRFSRMAGMTLWDLAQRCSQACGDLSDPGVDRFQAYLAGMGANIGLITALRVLDGGYPEQQPPDTEAFHDGLRVVAAKLSGRIARQWNFPRAVYRAIEQRADPQVAASGEPLTQTLRAAERISKWHMLVPGLAESALTGLTEPERRCYLELERAFTR